MEQECLVRPGTPSSLILTTGRKANHQGMRSIHPTSSQPCHSSVELMTKACLVSAVAEPGCCGGPRRLSGSTQSICRSLASFGDNLGWFLRVKDPVLDISIVVCRAVTCLAHWIDHILLPVVLDERLQILSISSLGMRDVVVREPPLKLGLVPFVVCFSLVSCALFAVTLWPLTSFASWKPSGGCGRGGERQHQGVCERESHSVGTMSPILPITRNSILCRFRSQTSRTVKASVHFAQAKQAAGPVVGSMTFGCRHVVVT